MEKLCNYFLIVIRTIFIMLLGCLFALVAGAVIFNFRTQDPDLSAVILMFLTTLHLVLVCEVTFTLEFRTRVIPARETRSETFMELFSRNEVRSVLLEA